MSKQPFTAHIEIIDGKHYVAVINSLDNSTLFISRPFDHRKDAEEMMIAINEGRAKFNMHL